MSGVMATFLLMPFLALAQTTEQPEWCNEYVSGVNKEEAVQIAIPFTCLLYTSLSWQSCFIWIFYVIS